MTVFIRTSEELYQHILKGREVPFGCEQVAVLLSWFDDDADSVRALELPPDRERDQPDCTK